MNIINRPSTTAMAILAVTISTAVADDAMMIGKDGYSTEPIFTGGENFDGYFPPGLLDGMFALDRGENVYLLANHEIAAELGYSYELENGTSISGARIFSFVIDKVTRSVTSAGLAFDKIYNRGGELVDHPSDLVFGGLNRLCSSSGVEAGTSGFVDAIYFAGEERSGGSQFALEVESGTLWAAPALGVGAW